MSSPWQRHPLAFATAVFLLALALGFELNAESAAAAPKAPGGIKEWQYKGGRPLPDGKSERISGQGAFIGRAKFLHNLVAWSKNFPGRGGPQRLYRISGSVSIRLKDDYRLLQVGCAQKVGRGGAFLAPSRRGILAFFPREGEPESDQPPIEIGLDLKVITVSVPVPGLDLFTTSLVPSVDWAVPNRSDEHGWSWTYEGDGGPEDELLSFLGHWGANARKVRYKIVCDVLSRRDFGQFQTGTVTYKQTFRP